MSVIKRLYARLKVIDCLKCNLNVHPVWVSSNYKGERSGIVAGELSHVLGRYPLIISSSLDYISIVQFFIHGGDDFSYEIMCIRDNPLFAGVEHYVIFEEIFQRICGLLVPPSERIRYYVKEVKS